MSTNSIRVCIIGAGPSGLSLLHAFEGIQNCTIVCYEKQPEIGGLWNITWRTGIDQYGIPVHSSQYYNLWSNGPKEGLEYADYTFEQHFQKSVPSFPPRAVLKDYITSRAKKENADRFCRFNTNVIQTTYHPDRAIFSVKSRDLLTEKTTVEEFDYVIVATGHFSVPNFPTYPGIETFEGRILHSHDFRNACEFKGNHVLLIGSSYSAEDIGLQLVKFGASSVTISYRTQEMGFLWPKNIDERPLLTEIQKKTVYFRNGTQKNFDAIIFCTGYLHKYPFLDDSLVLKTKNVQYPPLYKTVVFPENPKLMFIGAQEQYYTFTFFDGQAMYARDLIMGKISVPSKKEMEEDISFWIVEEQKTHDQDSKIDFQTKNLRDLYLQIKLEFNVDASEILKKWEREKKENILTYRDKSFISLFSKTASPIPKTPWWEAFDDSTEGFLKGF